MELHLPADQEAALRKVADESGIAVECLVQDAVERMLAHDAWFKDQVQIGLGQIDRGEFVSHEDVGAQIDRLFRE